MTSFTSFHSLHPLRRLQQRWQDWLTRITAPTNESRASLALRSEACPPDPLTIESTLATPTRGWSVEPQINRLGRLPQVRDEFLDSLADIRGAGFLMARITAAKSLRELWHLRSDVFTLVSVQRSQEEAVSRLSQLNRHFPTRAPRSGFGALGL